MKEARETRKMENSPSSPKDFTLILWNFHLWTKLLRFTLLEVQVSWDWVAVHWQSGSFPELIILLHPPLTLVNKIIKSMQLSTRGKLAGRTQSQTVEPVDPETSSLSALSTISTMPIMSIPSTKSTMSTQSILSTICPIHHVHFIHNQG